MFIIWILGNTTARPPQRIYVLRQLNRGFLETSGWLVAWVARGAQDLQPVLHLMKGAFQSGDGFVGDARLQHQPALRGESEKQVPGEAGQMCCLVVRHAVNATRSREATTGGSVVVAPAVIICAPGYSPFLHPIELD